MVGVGQAMEGTVGGWGIEMIDKTVCNNASTKDVFTEASFVLYTV